MFNWIKQNVEDSMSKVVNFPNWRINCTPIEKLREVLQYAESHPEEVNNLMVLWQDKNAMTQYEVSAKNELKDAIFMLENTKYMIFGLLK